MGNLVEVFHKLEKEKRGKWFSPRSVLSAHQSSGSITVPDSNICTITAALEDVRLEDSQDDNVQQVSESIDTIEE